MRITEIKIEGENSGHAVIRHSEQDGRVIVILTELANGHRMPMSVSASDRRAQCQMAAGLQALLDGYTGTAGDVQDYLSVIERFAV